MRPVELTAASIATTAPVAVLCWQRGGVEPFISSAVFAVVLTLAGLWFWREPSVGAISLPWPAVVAVSLPVLQLVPLGAAHEVLWQPWRRELNQAFAQLGVRSPSSISLYPFATLRAAVALSGCCALFVMARALAMRRRETVVGIVATLLAVAAAEAFLGLGQAARPPWMGTAAAFPPAHGTFVNRNHFAVLLEAGVCLAIGLAAFFRSRARLADSRNGLHRLAGILSLTAAAICLAGIALSGSRMGLLVGVATVLAAGCVFRELGQRAILLPAGLLTILLAAALSFPDTAQGFAKLLHDGGDPGRIAIWSDALQAAARHLPTGSGLGTFALAFRRSEPYFPGNTIDHAHNDWLELLVELGLPATLFLAGSISVVLAGGARRPERWTADELRPVRMACLLAAAAILLHSLVDFPLQIPALAALFAALLGCTHGLARRRAILGTATRKRRGLVALGCWLFAFAAVAVAQGEPASWNAESLGREGQRELLAGHTGLAAVSLRRSLAANPFAAAVWLQQAEAARMSGNAEKEIESLEIAARLEPFTMRTEWPAAQALLLRQRWEEAAVRLRRLAENVPEVQPAVLRAALDAGMPAARIAASVVPQDAAGTWLRLLADRDDGEGFSESLTLWAVSRNVAVEPQDLRYVFDALFQANRQRLMIRLGQAISGSDFPGPFRIRLPVAVPANSSGPSVRIHWPAPAASSAQGTGATPSWAPEDPFALTFGFQWASRPAPGVSLRIQETSPAGPFIELDFHAPPAGETVHLSRYFLATPHRVHVLRVSSLAEMAGGELRLEVWSPQRLLGSSPPLRRSRSWQTIRLPFRTEPGEHVLQLRLVSKAAQGKSMRGKFLLGTSEARPPETARAED